MYSINLKENQGGGWRYILCICQTAISTHRFCLKSLVFKHLVLNIHNSTFQESQSTSIVCHSACLHVLILFPVHQVFWGLNCLAIYNLHVRVGIPATAVAARYLDTSLLAFILQRPFCNWPLIMSCRTHTYKDWKLLNVHQVRSSVLSWVHTVTTFRMHIRVDCIKVLFSLAGEEIH